MRRRAAIAIASSFFILVTACNKGRESSRVSTADNRVAPRVARLYFESDSMLLVAEPRNVQLPGNPAAAMSLVVRELLKGPVNPALSRQFPADTTVRGAYLLPDGSAFIDLGGNTLAQGWSAGSHEELMAASSLVQTIASNFPEAKRVRILVNGMTAETLGGHLAIDRFLHPDSSLVDPRMR